MPLVPKKKKKKKKKEEVPKETNTTPVFATQPSFTPQTKIFFKIDLPSSLNVVMYRFSESYNAKSIPTYGTTPFYGERVNEYRLDEKHR